MFSHDVTAALLLPQNNREEKSSRHVAMGARVLDDDKPIKSLKSVFCTISSFTDLIQFRLIWQILAKFSLGPYLSLSKFRKRK